MDKSTTTLTCDNCDDSGFFIGRGGHLSTYCRRTGKPIPAYITLPTCNSPTLQFAVEANADLRRRGFQEYQTQLVKCE